jgi:hypothetical protein
MTKQELIRLTTDLEETIKSAHEVDELFYQDLLDDYFVHIEAMKNLKMSYPYDKAAAVQDRHSQIETKLPNVSQADFEEYVMLNDMLAILLN